MREYYSATIMKFNTKETALLLIGDIACFLASLFVSLFIRYGGNPPELSFLLLLTTWGVIFSASILSFFVAGLYEKHTLIFERNLPPLLLKAQIGNAIIVVIFFYFLPIFGASPKTTLFIYLVTSSILVFFWRLYGLKLFRHHRRSKAVLLGEGEEADELFKEINGNARYPFIFESKIYPTNFYNNLSKNKTLNQALGAEFESVSVIVADIDHPSIKISPWQIRLLFVPRAIFLDFESVYEDVFDRVPLSLSNRNSVFRDDFLSSAPLYDSFRRLIDFTLAFIFGLASLLLYPLVWMLIKIDDGGPLFFFQERVGQNNIPIEIVKFRSMKTDGSEVTKVGSFLRKSRIDELPQLLNVLNGSLSLIGPRPELPDLAKKYQMEIPLYNLRHIIKPGLSGWAQIYHENHPHHGPDISETKVKLSYDLYYLRYRSIFLDLKIALRTIQTLLSRSGV